MKAYAEWCRRRGASAQCNPVLGVIGIIVVAFATGYVYRKVILTTVLTAVLAAVGVAVLTGAVVLTVSTLRWYRARTRAMAADPSGATALATATDDADAAAISEEADRLADTAMELVFDKDGNLHAKTG